MPCPYFLGDNKTCIRQSKNYYKVLFRIRKIRVKHVRDNYINEFNVRETKKISL